MRTRWKILGAVALATATLVGGWGVYILRSLGPSLEVEPLCHLTAPGSWRIEDVTVFDSRAGVLLAHRDVQFEPPSIVAIGPTGMLTDPVDHTLSGVGMTLIPGFVNAHVHAMSPVGVPWSPVFPDPEYAMDAWLAAGVTTVFDLGGPSSMLEALAASVERGELAGPHLVHGDTMITVPGAHPLPAGAALMPWPVGALVAASLYVVEDAVEGEAAVRTIAATGAPWVKVIRDELPAGTSVMDASLLQTLIAQTQAHGMRSVVHVGDDADARAASSADLQAHLVYRGPISPETVNELRDHSTIVVPTVSSFAATAELVEARWAPSEWDLALHPPTLLSPLEGKSGSAIGSVEVIGDFAREVAANQHHWSGTLAALHTAEVRLLVGTDAPLPGVLPGSAYHRELDHLLDSGIPILDLLRSATWEPAEFLHSPPSFGAVEAGMRADLLLIRGDPTQDSSAIHAIEHVFLSGIHIERHLPRGAP